MSFGPQKAKKFGGTPPLSPHQGPVMDLLRGLQLPGASRPPAAFCTTRVSCTYNWGATSATNVDFFFSINPCEYSHLEF